MANRGPDGLKGGPLRLHHGFWERFLKQSINSLNIPYADQMGMLAAIALPLGRVTEMTVEPDGTTRWRGLLSQANPIAKVIWEMLKEGLVHLGVSVGGKINATRPGRDALGRPCTVICDVRLDELSITDNPANRLIESEAADNGAYIMALAKSLQTTVSPSPVDRFLEQMLDDDLAKAARQRMQEGATRMKNGRQEVLKNSRWRPAGSGNSGQGTTPTAKPATKPARKPRAKAAPQQLSLIPDGTPSRVKPKARKGKQWGATQQPQAPAAVGGAAMGASTLRPKKKAPLPQPTPVGNDDIFAKPKAKAKPKRSRKAKAEGGDDLGGFIPEGHLQPKGKERERVKAFANKTFTTDKDDTVKVVGWVPGGDPATGKGANNGLFTVQMDRNDGHSYKTHFSTESLERYVSSGFWKEDSGSKAESGDMPLKVNKQPTQKTKKESTPPPHSPEFKQQGHSLSRDDIQYYAHDPKTNRHHVVIAGERYSYEMPQAGEVKNFRHVDGDGKIVARNYKTFRNKLGIVPGSPVADALTTKLNTGKPLKKTGTTMAKVNQFLHKALGGSPGGEINSGSWRDTAIPSMGRGLGANSTNKPTGTKPVRLDASSSDTAARGIGGKQPKAHRPYSSGGMPPTDVWGMTVGQLTRELSKCCGMTKDAWGSPETSGFLTDAAHGLVGLTESPHPELINFVRFLQYLNQFAQQIPHMDDYQAAGTVAAMNTDLTKALGDFTETLPAELKGRPLRPPGSPGVRGIDIQFPSQYIVYS